MKLLKATTEEVREFNEVEFLQMENDFLKDELEFRDALHSLELMETVLKCIEQEGEVSKSIEVMFGEGQDMSTFKDELQAAYELFISSEFDKHLEFDKIERLIEAISARASELKTFVENNKSKITFPVEVNVTWKFDDFEKASRRMGTITRLLVERKWNKDYPNVRIDEFKELLKDIDAYIGERSKEAPVPHIERADYEDLTTNNPFSKVKSVYRYAVKEFKAVTKAFEKHVKKSDEPKSEAKVLIGKFKKAVAFALRTDLHHMLFGMNKALAAVKANVKA